MWVIEQHATMDFETRSQAGYEWNAEKGSWDPPKGAPKNKKGISAVGTYVYAEHPSTDVLCLYYKLPGDNDVSGWHPGDPPPIRLFAWIAAGGLVECHKAMFERAVWYLVMMRKYGWPPLPPKQLRCSMAKARVNNYPGALGELSKVLPVKIGKNEEGTRLINRFSVPQKPTKKDDRIWIDPTTDPEGPKLYAYCYQDVLAEEEISAMMMPMTAAELEFWQLDQEMNWRGIAVDRESVRNMTTVLDQALELYGDEFRIITGGLNPTQVQATQGWLRAKGVFMDSLDEEAIEEALARTNLPPEARRVLEIRSLIGSASVKKLYAIDRTAASDDRVRDIIVHHGARTGRPTGDLVQPLNLPKAGPDLIWCSSCNKPSKWPPVVCPWCGDHLSPLLRKYKWGDLPKGMDDTPHIDAVQEIMATRSLAVVEHFFGDALLAISGCVRGMIVAGPGKELIASDYSAIEAVVTAALSGCEWRMQAFRDGKDIYLVSCERMGGLSYEEYKKYYEEHNRNHHPDRQKKGKVAELGLGFGGWLTAWRQFDSSDAFTDAEVKQNILAWRAASPEIPEMWGGQTRDPIYENFPTLERYGFEGAFVNAIQYPGYEFESHGIHFYMRKDSLIIRLLSGRELVYHSPRLWESETRRGIFDITYMTWNSNSKYGAPGWVAMKTYSGRIAENIVQATAHDIQRYGILALEAAGYPVILHVYDEDVAEVPIGWGSLEEFERIMATMPPWAHDWPIRASGGWRGRRYRKG